MAVIVHLNHVFDNTVIERRMQYAFNNDGSEFWERFFLCETSHPNEKIVYLFTQPQLKYMYNWLERQALNLGEKIRTNLDLSRQSVFHDPLVKKPREPYGYYKLRSCYIFYNGNEPNIIETFRFSVSPPEKEEKGWNEFFNNAFINKLSSTIKANTPQEKIKELEKLKKIIGEKIAGPKIRKWLRYLGPKIFGNDHPSVSYCADIDPPCPMI